MMTTPCGECAYLNEPGVRFCAKCGNPLARGAAGSVDADRGAPPIAELPDPAPAVEAGRTHPDGWAGSGVGFGEPSAPPAIDRRSLWGGLGIAATVAVLIAWWFLGTSTPADEGASTRQAAGTAASTPASTAAPTSAPASALASASASGLTAAPASTLAAPSVATAGPLAAASAAIVAEIPALGPSAPSASGSAATAAAREPIAPEPPIAAAAPVAPRAASLHPPAARLPTLSEAEAQRLAFAKKAHDKAERESRVKAVTEQREQAALRVKAELENARRRAEEQRPQPPRPSVAAAPAPPAAPRGVRDLCAGRNPISQAVCESRECGNPEHVTEPTCRQLRASEERRRDLLN